MSQMISAVSLLLHTPWYAVVNALVQGHPFIAPHGRELFDVANWLRMCCSAVGAMSATLTRGTLLHLSRVAGILPCPSAGRPPFQGFCTGVPYILGEFNFMSVSGF